MKKLFLIFLVAAFAAACSDVPVQDEILEGDLMLKKGKKSECATIQSGELVDSNGGIITTGFDVWGYNYQAQMFNGLYGNYSRPETVLEEDDTKLIMKWNDAWMSTTDCDGDGLLDRHYGFESYIGSGAWLTNHQSGTYIDDDGNECKWTYFTKIVAAPADAELIDGMWYNSDGDEIGPEIWGSFATIQEVYNSPCEGEHGIAYLSPAGPGFGKY